jgi:hypothetical protein
MDAELNSPPKLEDLLLRVSWHLSAMAQNVATVEEIVASPSLGHPEAITKIQSLDYIRQSLEDLSALFLAMQDQAQSCWQEPVEIDALLQVLKLLDTKSLLDVETSQPGDQQTNVIGDLDLF